MVGGAELHRTAVVFDGRFGVGRELAQHRMLVRLHRQLGQVARAGDIHARQAARIDIVRVGHAQLAGLGVHRFDKRWLATRIVAAQCRRGAVFRTHQRDMQHVGAGQLGADAQARAAEFGAVDIFVGHGQHFVHILLGFDHHQAGHHLGDRSDRQGDVGILFKQDFGIGLIEHQRHAGLEVERIVRQAEAGQVAHGLDRRRGGDHALVHHLAAAVDLGDTLDHAVAGFDCGGAHRRPRLALGFAFFDHHFFRRGRMGGRSLGGGHAGGRKHQRNERT